jgi:hypothetical protein
MHRHVRQALPYSSLKSINDLKQNLPESRGRDPTDNISAACPTGTAEIPPEIAHGIQCPQMKVLIRSGYLVLYSAFDPPHPSSNN